MVTNKKLGKGLSSLLGKKEDLKEASTYKNNNTNGLLLVPIEKIFRDEQQPRKEFDQEKIKELSQSINKNGLIQPLILTERDSDTYTLVAGERRWRAAQLAKLKILPSLLLPTDLDKDEISLIENIQRENLKISEEAQAYQRLIEKNNYTHEDLGKIVGKSRSHITNLLRILSLDNYFFDLLNRDILSMGHARALIGKTPNDFDEDILLSITKGKISVRDVSWSGTVFKGTTIDPSQFTGQIKSLADNLDKEQLKDAAKQASSQLQDVAGDLQNQLGGFF